MGTFFLYDPMRRDDRPSVNYYRSDSNSNPTWQPPQGAPAYSYYQPPPGHYPPPGQPYAYPPPAHHAPPPHAYHHPPPPSHSYYPPPAPAGDYYRSPPQDSRHQDSGRDGYYRGGNRPK